MNYLKTFLTTLILLTITLTSQAQVVTQSTDQYIQDINFISSGYWVLVAPDTTMNSRTERETLEKATNLILQGVDPADISITPYNVRIEATVSNVWEQEVRNFDATVETPSTDSTMLYDLVVTGTSPAPTINVAVNCYDSTTNSRPSTSLQNDGTNNFRWVQPMLCNGILTYWVTATLSTGEQVRKVDFVDVGHRLSIGN